MPRSSGKKDQGTERLTRNRRDHDETTRAAPTASRVHPAARLSGRIVGEVFHHAPDDLPKLDFLVLLALAEDAHEKNRTAAKECSAELLAYKARSTAASVRQALKRLKDRGLIRPVHSQVGPGKQQNWVITKLSSYHREGGRHAADEPPNV